jgi:transcriptional regulator with XRE-family HTH domain
MTRPRLDAERLRTLRRQRHWTQADLARRAGVSLKVVQAAEQGRTQPRPDTLRKLARVLGVEVGDLFVKEGVGQNTTGP